MVKSLQEQLQQIRSYVRKPRALCTKKGRLHRFRVALKHWRANLRLLEAADPCFPYPEIYAPFKTLFGQAGAVRFWQLQGALVKSTGVCPAFFAGFYETHIRKQRKQAQKAFRQALRRERMFRWKDLKQEFRLSVRQCTPQALEAYFRDLQKKIGQECLAPPESRDFHDLRKALKEYRINRQTAVQHFGLDPGPVAGIPDGSTDLDTTLGQWHDFDAAAWQLRLDLDNQPWPDSMRAEGLVLLEYWKQQAQANLRQAKASLVALQTQL